MKGMQRRVIIEPMGRRGFMYRNWIIKVPICIGCLLTILGFFNYWIDPFWCFSHSNRLNRYQKSIDERQQKTNLLTFGKNRYDAVIFGNSRTAQIDQNAFTGMHAFNYSVSAMLPREYKGYLDYFKKINGIPGTIILGLDFDNTNAILKSSGPAEPRIARSNSFLYRYTTLLLKDTLKFSFEDARLGRRLEHKTVKDWMIVYDRNNVASIPQTKNKIERQLLVDKQIGDLVEAYGSHYAYNEDLKNQLRELKENNPGSKFIVFTSPVTKRYICTMVKEHRLPEYERWLKEIVDIYGEVWHFQYVHSISLNQESAFSDAHHSFPWVGELIAHKITGTPDPCLPADFGMLLNRSNIEEKLAYLRRDFERVCGE